MRINGISVTAPRAGTFYLLRRRPMGGSESYVLSEAPGRTNMGRRELDQGWLGTTGDVAWYAEEGVVVEQGEAGRWRVRFVTAAEVRAAQEAEVVE